MMFIPSTFHLVKTLNKRAFEREYQNNPLTTQDFNDWRALGNTVGVMTGKECVINGRRCCLYVLDVDDVEAATEWLLSLGLPLTLLVETPSGGYHYYFWYDGPPLPRKIRPYPGVDLLGKGGYANCHLIKGSYTHYNVDHIAEMPESLLREWQAADAGTVANADFLLSPGSRNNTTARLAGSLLASKMPVQDVHDHLQTINANTEHPLPQIEVANVVASISRYHVEPEPEVIHHKPGLIMSRAAVVALDLPPIETVIGPIKTAGVTMLAGASGIGKSFLALHLAHHIAAGRAFGHNVDWAVPKARRVLFVDAEMATQYTQERLKTCIEAPVDFINLASMQDNGAFVDFGQEAWRNYFARPEIFDNYEVFMFDTVSALILGTDTVSVFVPQYWLQLEPFHQKCRAAGKTVIWVDNLNKRGETFGTAAKIHKVDTAIRLNKWDGQKDPHAAGFELDFEKYRHERSEMVAFWEYDSVLGWKGYN